MRRYDVTTVTDDTGCFGAMDEHAEGEWVYYGDAAALQAENAELRKALEWYAKDAYCDTQGLRDALSWYADKTNWMVPLYSVDTPMGIWSGNNSHAVNDAGARARAVLEGEK